MCYNTTTLFSTAEQIRRSQYIVGKMQYAKNTKILCYIQSHFALYAYCAQQYVLCNGSCSTSCK